MPDQTYSEGDSLDKEELDIDEGSQEDDMTDLKQSMSSSSHLQSNFNHQSMSSEYRPQMPAP